MAKLVCPSNYIMVTMEKRFQDEVETASGLKLYKDTSFKPEENTTVTGIVYSVPKKLVGSQEVMSIVPEAVEGDEIIFSYLVVLDWHRSDGYSDIHYNEVVHEGQSLWKVDYQLVLGYIRDGVIKPASGYMFLEAVEEELDEVMSSGLILPTMLRKRKVEGRAVVRHIGVPLKGAEPLDVMEGDTVIFDKRFVERYEIKGKEWLVLRQERVLAKQLY